MVIEGYFRRSFRSIPNTAFQFILWMICILLAIYGLLIQDYLVVLGSIVVLVCVILMFHQREKRRLVYVRLSGDTLLIKGGGYHIQLKAPFRYQTGVQLMRSTNRKPEHHYVRMVLDVYGKPLVFEEHVSAGIQPPQLQEILGVSSALGIAELSSLTPYPGTLWSMIQQLEMVKSQSNADKIKRDIEDLYRIGGQQLIKQFYGEAVKTFSEIIRLTPDSSHAYLNRGMARYYQRRDYDRALTDLTTAIRLKPKFSKAYQIRGLVKAELDDWAGLRDDCSIAIQLNPESAELYNLRGGACYRLKDYQGALADFEKAIKYNKLLPEAYYNRGLIQEVQGNIDEAIADFRYALQLNPALDGAARSLERIENYKKSSEENS